jgi:hypothetical protein
VEKRTLGCCRGAVVLQLMVIGVAMAGSILFFSNRVSDIKRRLTQNKKVEAYKSVMRGVMAYGYYVLKERIHIKPSTGLIDPTNILITDENSLERLLLKNNASNDLKTLYGENGVALPELVNYFSTNEFIGNTEYEFIVKKSNINASHPLFVVFDSGADGQRGEKIQYQYKSSLEGATSEVLVKITATLIGKNDEELAHASGHLIYYPRQVNQFALTLARNLIIPPAGSSGPTGGGDGIVQAAKYNVIKSPMLFLSPVMVNGNIVIPRQNGADDIQFMAPVILNGNLKQGGDLDDDNYIVDTDINHLTYLSQYPGFTGFKRGMYMGKYEHALENIFAHNAAVIDTERMERCIDYQNRKYDIALTNNSQLLIKRLSSDQLLLGLSKQNEFVNVAKGGATGMAELVVGSHKVQLATDYPQIISLPDAAVVVPQVGSNIEKKNGHWVQKVVIPAVICPAPLPGPGVTPACTPTPERTEYNPVVVPNVEVNLHKGGDNYSKSVVELKYKVDSINTAHWVIDNGNFKINAHNFLTDPATGDDTRSDLPPGVTIISPKAAPPLKIISGNLLLNNAVDASYDWTDVENNVPTLLNEEWDQLKEKPDFWDYTVCDGTATTTDATATTESYNISYASTAHTSWNYNNVWKDKTPDGAKLGQFYPDPAIDAATYANYYDTTTELANAQDFSSGNQDTFHSLSIMDRCVVKSTATHVMGFLICRHLIIENRVTPLSMIGSFVVDKLTNESTSEIKWMNIFHPDARAKLDLTGNGFLSAGSASCKVNPTTPLWRADISSSERSDMLRCDPAFFLQKADPFRWTTFDPLCGLIGAASTGTTCKPGSRSFNFWFTVLNERYW